MAFGDFPTWTIPGVVLEVRKLVVKRTRTPWAALVRIMALGAIYEVIAEDPAMWDAVGEGEEVIASGRFDMFNGGMRLVLTGVRSGGGA